MGASVLRAEDIGAALGDVGAVSRGAAGPHGLHPQFKPDQLFPTGQGTDKGLKWNTRALSLLPTSYNDPRSLPPLALSAPGSPTLKKISRSQRPPDHFQTNVFVYPAFLLQRNKCSDSFNTPSTFYNFWKLLPFVLSVELKIHFFH